MKKTKELVAVVTDNVLAIDALAEEIKATFTERVFAAREEILIAHHEAGKFMAEMVASTPSLKITRLVELLVERGAANERTLWDCYKFYTTYPKFNDIEALGYGKNVSWNKIKRALNGKEEKAPKVKSVDVTFTRQQFLSLFKIKPISDIEFCFTYSALDVDLNIKVLAPPEGFVPLSEHGEVPLYETFN